MEESTPTTLAMERVLPARPSGTMPPPKEFSSTNVMPPPKVMGPPKAKMLTALASGAADQSQTHTKRSISTSGADSMAQSTEFNHPAPCIDSSATEVAIVAPGGAADLEHAVNLAPRYSTEPVGSSYRPPPWSAVPRANFFLEVIKEGVIIERLDVSKRAHFVLGRHPSTADLVVPHPSVSRQHAVLQHRDTGEVFLFDLGSTHGTTVNKKPAPRHAYVALRTGAMIRLGQSSRHLCLMGDIDPARETDAASAVSKSKAEAHTQRAEQRAARIAAQTGRSRISAEDLHASGAGWGFDEDALDDTGEADDDGLGSLTFDQLCAQAKSKSLPLSSKQERLLEQLEKRMGKMEHLKQEVERIAAKEVDGLSQGQTMQIDRNTARLKELSDQVDSLKEQISETIRDQMGARRMLDGKTSHGSHVDVNHEYDNSDDDDFFDRTHARRGSNVRRGLGAKAGAIQPQTARMGHSEKQVDSVAQSEAALREQLAAAKQERAQIVQKQDILSADRATLSAQATSDPLEAYMHANAVEVAQNRARELNSNLKEIDDEISRLSALVDFVAPALPSAPSSHTESELEPSSTSISVLQPTRSRSAPESRVSSTDHRRPEVHGDDHSHPSKRPKYPDADPEVAPSDNVAQRAQSAVDRFRSDYAAAVSSITDAGPISITEDSSSRVFSSEVAGQCCSGVAAETVSGQPVEKTSDSIRGGVGFGAVAPDRVQVASAQAQRKQDGLLQPGLNRSQPTVNATISPSFHPAQSAATRTSPSEMKSRKKQGPALPSPRAHGGSEYTPVASDAADNADDLWTPPAAQSGDGKSFLNERFGY